MKSTGIVRKIDELGRIVIPIELRRTLDIEDRAAMEIFTDDLGIILRKYELRCVFCGSTENVIKFKGKNICKDCVSSLKDL